MQKLFYNEFKKTLGVSDAINEYIEVLLRQFERSSYDEASFQELASEFGIRVNDVSPKDAIGKIREYYIVTVFQTFEFFLKQLDGFLREYGIYKENKDSSTPMLKHIHKSLLGMKQTSDTAYLYYLICDYYRLVRNLCAHTDNVKKVQDAYQKLLDRKEEISTLFQKLDAPNKYGNINFDDFILYSRAAKKLAEMYKDNIKYDIDKIVNNYDMKRFCVFRNNSERLRKSVENEIKVKFCMSTETVKNVVDKLVEKV